MGESDPPRRLSVHQALGGGSVADVFLWRRWFGGSSVLVSAKMVWLLFERNGYNPLTFVANGLLLLVLILFFWAKSASLLNRPLPALPNLEISEKSITKVTNVLLQWINYALSIAQDITVNHNLKLFAQVSCGLYALYYIGGLFSFLTFAYIGIILLLSVPVFYDKCQDHVNDKLCVIHRFVQTQYKKIDDNILKKIPLPSSKAKKVQ
ncbi:reticulon-like protein B11 [Punica granatum]|uniref:Reticulon-like protein B11 n=2 Tax=Punica granatum TaxID=22663 RepID=A0A6P8CT78_PUNGR|nr:reticulon-like protein B11 [Punica granatum]XP_031382953.1 reticulon-like protein B11 [Punica granatum]OWM79197.1 hypothetical protein CDL15_Pgr003368 [Punica granatum]PKI33508.1 hypothetical protein CRG98_046064 [Punica granatum]